MHSLYHRGEVSYFSFLSTGSKTPSKIDKLRDKIIDKPVICDERIKEKCQLIKEIILNKIDNGLTVEQYKDIRTALIALENLDIIENIDIIVNILEKENNEIINITKKEIESHNYISTVERKETINSEGKKIYVTANKEITIGLIFELLKENIGNYKIFLYNYADKILKLNEKEDYDLLLEISNDIYENENSEYLKIVNQCFEEKFSYLKDSKSFSDMYVLFKSKLRIEIIRILNYRYNKQNLYYEAYKSTRRNIKERR